MRVTANKKEMMKISKKGFTREGSLYCATEVSGSSKKLSKRIKLRLFKSKKKSVHL